MVRQSWQEFAGNVGQGLSFLVQKIASPTVEAAGNAAMRLPRVLVNVVVTILSSYFLSQKETKSSNFGESICRKKEISITAI